MLARAIGAIGPGQAGEATGATGAAGAGQAGELNVPLPLIDAITGAIMRCCGHRPLKARRLAHGWTIEAAVAAFHAMCQEHGLGTHALHVRSWLEWEAGEHPRASHQDLLCRLFRTDRSASGSAAPTPAVAPSPNTGR